MNSWQQKKSKIRAELTVTLTFTLTTLTTLTHRGAAFNTRTSQAG
jgi:hypothetical protein